MWRRRTPRPGVVASVEEQTEQAAALARITGQGRLTDPRTNPAVRAHADQLRDDQHRRSLDAEHSRLVRRHRVEDRRADHAEKTLEAIRAARETTSPARSVVALYAGRRRFLGVAMTASLALSAGSAIGVAHLAAALGAPSEIGYIAEVGLTGLSTTSVLYRSHLAEHRGVLEGWQNRVLWALTVVPLLASVVANAVSVGAVGVFCSIGAAAFSLLSAVIADRSAATVQARAAEVTDEDRAELEAIAMGDDLFAAPVGDEPTEAEQDAARLDAIFSDAELATWMQEPPEDGVTSSPVPPVDGGPYGAAHSLPDPSEGETVRPGQIDAEQAGDDAETPAGSRVESAVEARRRVGEVNRARVAGYVAQRPAATVEEIAAALGLSVSTVKRHRRTIRSGE